MEDWKKRVLEEKDELEQRLKKLKIFISSEAFNKVDSVNQILLTRQDNIMTEYLNILNDRIRLFEN
jgi:hypothetical protein